MQKVSKEYKASMKESLRERSYMMISFGLVNQEAMANATIEGKDFTYFSHQDNLFGQRSDNYVYGTLEQDFTKVDGSMYFLPRQNASATYYDTGLISGTVIEGQPYELLIELNVIATDIKGLTLDFGEIYPVDFDILTSSGQVIKERDNDKSLFTIEDVLVKTTYIKFRFYRMKNGCNRLRIYSIQLGYGLVYYNEDIMDSQLDSYTSPICEDVPQVDFFVKLQNYDQYFNVDNPDSAINFLETGQEMQVYYGYWLPESEKIEWVKGATLECSEWESDDYTATIRCRDILRSADEEYYHGCYNSVGVTMYELAERVYADAGIENYYIDPYLKKIISKNPLPRVKHKEALQIIANACRCVLTFNRNGVPQIKSSFAPEYELKCNGEMPYSHLINIKKDERKDEYSTFAHNYTTVAEPKMYHLPEDATKANKYTGYTSIQQSDENGLFAVNPMITATQESACKYFGLKMIFGQALPAEIIFRTFCYGELVEETVVNEDIVKNFVFQHEFDDFDVMEIEFTKTAEPYNRIVVDSFAFGEITEFTMERKEMTNSPKAIKQELVKQVIVPCYTYSKKGTEEETLVSEETEAVKGDIITCFFGDATYDRVAKFNGSTSNLQVLDQGDYYITVKFLISGKYQLEIVGHRYNITTKNAVRVLNARGKTVTWKNPMISDLTTAQNLANWIGDYYDAGIEYEYKTRGNPEIDVNDIIFQENAYRPGMKVNIYRHVVNFSTSLSGSVIARRVSETEKTI